MVDYSYLEKLETLQRQIHKKYIQGWNAMSPMKLTMPQASLLQCLERQGALKGAELADHMCMTAGALTTLCDKLVERGWIERIRDEGDRRIVFVKITGKGRTLVESVRQLKAVLLERMLRGVPEQDLQVMDKVFTSALRNLEEDHAGPGKAAGQ